MENIVVQAITHETTVLFFLNDSGLMQDAQVMGNRHHFRPNRGRKLGHVHRTWPQLVDNPQTDRVA